MHIVLVHGFNVPDGGTGTVDKFAAYLRCLGHTVDLDEADYGFWTLKMIYFGRKRNVIRRLMAAFLDADIIITHSNGQSFAYKALNRMAPRTRPLHRYVVAFSPALNRGTDIPFAVDHQIVYHTRSDWVVRLASYLPFLPWGRQGAFGYKGDGPNTNVDETGKISGHSNWMKGLNSSMYMADMLRRLRELFPNDQTLHKVD